MSSFLNTEVTQWSGFLRGSGLRSLATFPRFVQLEMKLKNRSMAPRTSFRESFVSIILVEGGALDIHLRGVYKVPLLQLETMLCPEVQTNHAVESEPRMECCTAGAGGDVWRLFISSWAETIMK